MSGNGKSGDIFYKVNSWKKWYDDTEVDNDKKLLLKGIVDMDFYNFWFTRFGIILYLNKVFPHLSHARNNL